MNILFICNYPIDNNKPLGGVESVIYSLIQALRNNKEHNYYFLQIKPHKSNRKVSIIEEKGIKYYSLPYFNFLHSVMYTRRFIKSIIKDEKIDIINFIGSGPMLLKIPINKINIPIVVTQHGVLKQELKYVGIYNKPKFLFKYIIDKYYLPKFKYGIFISNYIREYTGNNLYYDIIPNPIYIDLDEKSFVKQNSRTEIIVVGNISRLKNQILAITALKELVKLGYDLQLKIIGNIKENKYYKKLTKLIENNNYILNRVEIIKGLSRQETLINIKNSDILLVTSLQENLPMVIGEAMMLNTIVVAPKIGGIPEMIINKKTGYTYIHNDLKSLIDTLSLALENNKNNELIRLKAHQWAEKTYNPQNILNKTLNFFSHILNEKKEK